MRRRHDAVLPGQLQLSVLEAAERVTRSGPPAQPPDRSPVHVGCSNSVYARLYASLVVARGGGAGGSRVGGQFVRRGRAGGSRVGGQFGRCGRPGAAPASAATAATARAVDGDYKVRNSHTSQAKDADGDYRPLASSTAAQSSSAVQASSDLPQDRRLSHIVRPDRR